MNKSEEQVNQYRKMVIHFADQAGLDELSETLFSGTDYKLLKNMKDVFINESSFDFVYKHTSKEKPVPIKDWQKHWVDMTYEFSPEKKKDYAKLMFNFDASFDEAKLSKVLNQKITVKTKAINYPVKESEGDNLLRIIGNRGNPQYPIYIVSKGRARTCITADHLIKMHVPFRIIIEKSDWDAYAEVYGAENLLELDMSYKTNYDTYDSHNPNVPKSKSTGPGPARNFAWNHAKNVLGAKWHWVMDDNIFGFTYYKDQKRIKAVDGTLFASAEDFINRYDNIGISGLNYYMFAVPGSKDRPYVDNTRIFSCLLINNAIPIRWAGRYNEDVDICIRAMKEGYSTIQFDAFLAKKGGTQLMAGGNTDAFYASEGTLPKSNMLAYAHPDLSHVQWRFMRWHHISTFNRFKEYCRRTISETIIDLCKKPILNISTDSSIIEEIKSINFKEITRWNILKSVPEPKRTDVLNVLKSMRYTEDTNRIIKFLTKEATLNCDYYDYLWRNDLKDTKDNNLMLKLFKLGKDDILIDNPNWAEVLQGFPEDKAKEIEFAMKRNKYLRNSSRETFNYDITQLKLSKEDHIKNSDSKNAILNNYINKNDNLEVHKTLFDKRILGEIKQTQKQFENKLTSRYETAIKADEEYTVAIHGSSDFSDEDLFLEKTKELVLNNDTVTEIINSVWYPVDLFAANLALDNKLKNKEFVPDEIRHSAAMYKYIYKDMATYADECILFCTKLNKDLEYLISEFEKQDKKITIITSGTSTDSLEEW